MNAEWNEDTETQTNYRNSLASIHADITIIRAELAAASGERNENKVLLNNLLTRMESIAISQAVSKQNECPSPGKCLILERKLAELEIDLKVMRDERMTARGALVVIGSVATFILGIGAWFVKNEIERHGTKGP